MRLGGGQPIRKTNHSVGGQHCWVGSSMLSREKYTGANRLHNKSAKGPTAPNRVDGAQRPE